MKKVFNIYKLVIILSITLFACSKKNDPVKPIAPSTWNVLGNDYKATKGNALSDSILYAIDTISTNYSDISLDFGAVPVSGVYSIVSPTSDFIAPDQCAIFLIYGDAVTTNYLVSASGGNVTVTVTNNKITAAFNNVTMSKEISYSINTGYTFMAVSTASGIINQQ